MGFLSSAGNKAFSMAGGLLSGSWKAVIIVLGIILALGIGYYIVSMINESKSWKMQLRIKKEVKGKRLDGYEFIPMRWDINPITMKQTGLWELKEPKFFKSKLVPPCGKQITNNTYAIIIDEFGNIFDDEGEVYDVSTGKTYGMKNFSGIGISFDRQRKNNKVLGGNLRETNLGLIFASIIKILLIIGAVFLLFTILKNDYNIKQQNLDLNRQIIQQQQNMSFSLSEFEKKIELNEQYNKFLFEQLYGKPMIAQVDYNFKLYQINQTEGN